jgi:hypothetical protein
MINTIAFLDSRRNRINFSVNFTRIFSSLTNLTHLNLSSVGLTTFDALNLTNIYFINYLDLSFNKIESLYKNHTSFIELIVSVYLNNNEISFIERDCFIDLKSLTILNLENNYLLDLSFNEFPIF